ncbi:hypothetical protein QCA50_010666 [Cerrena zonata]|uniref:SET domain-containing protein n=1 Tax=Cerrena zonata TaxID=2478898 RepID=A0AAW0G986_9APHY
MPKTLEIRTNDFSGRSYYSTCALPTNETVLDIDTPYSCTIYKQFRTEVCAECFDYQSGRRGFLTCREYSENAGLSFCDPDCRDVWIRREGVDLIGYLAKLETRRLKKKGKETGCLRAVVTDEEIEEAWGRVEEEEHSFKQARKWGQLLLDDFEADIARYVLMALYHQSLEPQPSQEFCHLTSNGDEPSTLAPVALFLDLDMQTGTHFLLYSQTKPHRLISFRNCWITIFEYTRSSKRFLVNLFDGHLSRKS